MCKACGCNQKDKKNPLYGKGPKVSKSALDYLRTEALLSLSKGEGPGHPFRGNQYTEGKTGGGKGKSKESYGMEGMSRADIAGMTEDEYNMDELRANRDEHMANLELEADLHGTGTQMYKDTKMLLDQVNDALKSAGVKSQ